MISPGQLEVVVGILTPIGAGSVWLLSVVREPWKRFNEMLEDWHGDGARPGVPPRLGVMVRLQKLEERSLAHTDEEIESIVERVFERQDVANVAITKQLNSIEKEVTRHE